MVIGGVSEQIENCLWWGRDEPGPRRDLATFVVGCCDYV